MSEIPFAAAAEAYIQKPWGGVTDPQKHNPANFRYLVHLDSGRSAGDPEDDLWEYVLKNPHLLKTMPSISTSLVDQDHALLYQGTPSTHGFILEVPPSSVIAAHSMDMFSRNRDIEDVARNNAVIDPDQLLRDTKPTDWNEVVVAPEGLVIKAVFWVNNQTGDEPTYGYEAVKHAAAANGLPFLELDLLKY